MPLLVILSGILGGLILTIAVILIVIFCRKNLVKGKKGGKENTKTPSDLLTIKPMAPRPPSGSGDEDDEVAMTAAANKAPSSTSTSTSAADGLSNNSSDMKQPVVTSVGEDYWDSERYRTATSRAAADYVDSGAIPAGLPSAFEHQSYNQYYNNLVQASNSYFSNSPNDSSRYSVHVRESPISPAHSGISVKAGGYSARPGNTSFDYMPASAFLGPPGTTVSSATMPRNYNRYPSTADNYSVYVNGSGTKGYGGHHHEVVVPVHEGSTGSGGSSSKASSSGNSAASGSLATHV